MFCYHPKSPLIAISGHWIGGGVLFLTLMLQIVEGREGMNLADGN
jgi:hypothetical protein